MKSELYEALEEFVEGENRFYSLDVISCANADTLVVEAEKGEQYAKEMVYLCWCALREFESAGMACLLCDKQFNRSHYPYAFVFLRRSDGLGPCLIQCLCELDTKLPDLQERVISKYQATFMPDAQVLQSGHA